MGGWDDAGYYEQEAAYEAMIQDAVKSISDGGVQGYLGRNGDAIDGRVLGSIRQAQQLLKAGFAQPAVVVATTAIEIIVRYFLIRPLIQAAFLSEEWAYLLTERVASGRTAEDRNLLPKILEEHDVDISGVLLEGGGRFGRRSLVRCTLSATASFTWPSPRPRPTRFSPLNAPSAFALMWCFR